jgi:lysophospholipase L1-like esterase
MRFHRYVSLLTIVFCLSSFGAVPNPGTVASPHWVGSWSAAPMGLPNADKLYTSDTTFRSTVHLSLGGPVIRLIFTNEAGILPLTLGAISVAKTESASSGRIKTDTSLPVLFNGKPDITIPPRAVAMSDPIEMPVAPLSDITVTYFVPGQTIPFLTQHTAAMATNYSAPGNQLTAPSLKQSEPLPHWRFLRGVDVAAPDDAGAIVTLGDSITNGAQSTPNDNARWPDVLARRLQADKSLSHLAVLNEGIGGNRILHNDVGPSALVRFDRDVFSQRGVRYLIILEGVNDIGYGKARNPNERVTADDLIAGLLQMIERAHAHGIKVIGATITPYEGARYSSPEGEQTRESVNKFIRTSGRFDGVVDFEKVLADPNHPNAINPKFNHTDGLHPNDDGYEAMGKAIDLALFR